MKKTHFQNSFSLFLGGLIFLVTSLSAANIKGRDVPNPIYGITLDDVSNVTSELASIKQLVHMPTTRIYFDIHSGPTEYLSAIKTLRPSTYIMGELVDSSDMSNRRASLSDIVTRTQQYTATLGNLVDIWEIGNEVNGNWLGSGVMAKIEAMYKGVASQGGATALTFFYEGEPGQKGNCIATDHGGNDMFTWITNNFQLNLPPSQRPSSSEAMRLGLTYVLISWYPQDCNNLQVNWTTVFNKLATIFPNSKLGFGEIGTANPQGGSSYEVNLIKQFYTLAKTTTLPSQYVGGYFWWYYAEEMVPTNKTSLFNVLNTAIQ